MSILLATGRSRSLFHQFWGSSLVSPRPTEHYKSIHLRSFPGQGNTQSSTNLVQWQSAVLRTFKGSTPTHLTDLIHSKKSITLKWIQQCHQYKMQGRRCQMKVRLPLEKPLIAWYNKTFWSHTLSQHLGYLQWLIQWSHQVKWGLVL